ncbi:uncharacterized protein PFL1_01272 [Pseudozyma flocculosa PF-1]|uniref:DUF1279 domain-containing protein n=1 Tax=Pseudozyma flocculosa TaxID=84751 RepID=A0A5C3EUE5_9BASI|nr:uncharacterized protein PFL1_01272 [Pseudozyma flocculosa PF-1]EPQ31083.1 hypothetical protein PFL1_01272 [Pseudozyma flocculosa PF-1]SPO35938.1 uncharacterized protein PSFLO_01409 [Pseudozyma flocculosa]
MLRSQTARRVASSSASTLTARPQSLAPARSLVRSASTRPSAAAPLALFPHPLASRATPGAPRMVLASVRPFSVHSAVPKPQPDPRRPEQEQEQEEQDKEDEEEERKARKGSLKDRLRYLTRRYGWWALGVYLAASSVDLGLTFAAIHMLGADHIRQLETRVRDAVGLSKRQESDEEREQREQDERDQQQPGAAGADKKRQGGSSTIWTELVLAYTIHKTLLLPVRVAFTAAVTPSFVKWLVKMGWAKSAAAVRKAAKEAAIKKAAKKAASS